MSPFLGRSKNQKTKFSRGDCQTRPVNEIDDWCETHGQWAHLCHHLGDIQVQTNPSGPNSFYDPQVIPVRGAGGQDRQTVAVRLERLADESEDVLVDLDKELDELERLIGDPHDHR